jgi:hypothetical protein
MAINASATPQDDILSTKISELEIGGCNDAINAVSWATSSNTSSSRTCGLGDLLSGLISSVSRRLCNSSEANPQLPPAAFRTTSFALRNKSTASSAYAGFLEPETGAPGRRARRLSVFGRRKVAGASGRQASCRSAVRAVRRPLRRTSGSSWRLGWAALEQAAYAAYRLFQRQEIDGKTAGRYISPSSITMKTSRDFLN